MLDKYYTPVSIARAMTEAVTISDAKIVADFTSGNGAILIEAQDLWPDSSLFANDICEKALSELQKNIPQCTVAACDFLSIESRKTSKLLRGLVSECDLIFLNPPYSYRGEFTYIIGEDSRKITCPRALAFVLASLDYLSVSGQLIGLLPNGAIFGDRSQVAIDYIKESYDLNVISELQENTFNDCSAKTVIVSIKHKVPTSKRSSEESFENIASRCKYDVIRGNTSMNTVGNGDVSKIPLLHSTNLTEVGVQVNGLRGTSISRTITGPAVLVQRVGRVKEHKVAAIYQKTELALSDCIIAIKTESNNEAKLLEKFIRNDWKGFLRIYNGTCAKYTTVSRLKKYLSQVVL